MILILIVPRFRARMILILILPAMLALCNEISTFWKIPTEGTPCLYCWEVDSDVHKFPDFYPDDFDFHSHGLEAAHPGRFYFRFD